MELINKNGSINDHESFTFSEGKSKGMPMRIVATYGEDKTIWNVTDTVKNLTTGKLTTTERFRINNLKPKIN